MQLMPQFRHLDWDEILERLSRYATSEAARQTLQKLTPLSSARAAQENFEKVAAALEVVEQGARCRMESLDLCGVWQLRLDKEAVLKPLELKDVRHFCLEVIALKETLKEHESPWAKGLRERLMEASEPLSAIDHLMTPEGDIRSDASETLFKLFSERASQTRALQNILDRLVKQHDLEVVLQDRYVTNREGRWVLPVKSGRQHEFEGIIHSSSQSKQTVFMEPKEVIPLNNRLRQIEVEIEEEIERLLADLSRYLFRQRSGFETSRLALLEADLLFSQAQLTSHIDGQPVTFSENEILLEGLAHPLLIMGEGDVVTNSVQLGGDRRLLLLSGPNAGGKTVLLKSVGLAAHMARCGLPICAAAGSRIPFFKAIHVAVGDAQSVDAHLSTFAAHLKVLSDATSAKGPDHLLLIDEICGSTDPEEGSALARAFIEQYAANHVFGVVTSHLGPLKLGWRDKSGVVNGSLEYDARTGKPTYQFLMGVSGQSMAIQTARRVGVSEAVIERALSHLSPEAKQYQMGLQEIESMKGELLGLREQLKKDSARALEREKAAEELKSRLEKEKDSLLQKAVRDAERQIDEMLEKTKVVEAFRRHETLLKTKLDLPEIIKTAVKPATKPLATAEDFAKAFPPGSKVFAPSMGQDALVQGTPNTRGEVPILANSLRLMIPWSQLRPPQQGASPTVTLARRAAGVESAMRSGDRVIDVRGLRVEEAIQRIESQLDSAALQQEDRVKIIHGHGTDALKKAVRQYLSRSPYIKKWQVGGNDSGGEGVTWAELND